MVWQQEHRLNYEDFTARHRLMLFFFVGLFLLLGMRLFHLQVVRGAYYRYVSEQQRTHVVIERGPRGVIYDCTGAPMVRNRIGFVALFYPFTQGTSPSPAIIDRLKGILGRDMGPAITRGWRSGQAVRLADNLTREEMFRLQEQRLVLPGISVVKESRRDYQQALANGHLVGYLNEVTARELEDLAPQGFKPGDWIGRRGIEKMYDEYLRGQDGGWQIEVDAQGRQTRLVKRIVPAIGASVYTTVDLRLQQVAYDELTRSSSGRGAVIALDPNTGAVKALVSTPGYDPNLAFTREFSQYLRDKRLPLFNRATQGLYPPGSTFKIVTFVAALNEAKVAVDQAVTCTGKFVLGNKAFGCWLKTGHGTLTLLPALVNSCNVYFYTLGQRVGITLLERYAKDFLLGQKTGIDLPSEKKGLVPGPEWKRNKAREPWHQGDTVNMAIGQGSLWVTPVQMACLAAAVANGGTVYRPYIVSSAVSPTGETLYEAEPQARGSVQLNDRTWELLRSALRDVVRWGTGRGCEIPGFPVAGKTGTAQNPHGNDHAWFVSYGPVDKPGLAVAVIVENGGHGGAAAVPVARRLYETYFGIARSTGVVSVEEAGGPQ